MKTALRELSHFWKWLLAAVIGTIIGAAADLLLPMHFANIINRGIMEKDVPYIWYMGLTMLVTVVISVLGSVMSVYCSSRASTGFARNMRRKVFSKLQTFTQAEMGDFGASTILTRNTNDIGQVQTFVIMFVLIMVRSPIFMIGGTIMAFRQNAAIATPFLVAIPIIVLSVVLVAKFVMPLFLKVQKKVDTVNLVLREQITGIRVVRAFGNEDFEEKRFEEASMDLSKTAFTMNTRLAFMGPILFLIINFTTLAILWLSVGQITSMGGIMIGDVLATVQFTFPIMFSLIMLSMVFVMYPRAQVSAKRIDEILNREPSIQDLENPTPLPKERMATVEFKNVTFTFPGAERPTLKNISFVSTIGESTAIIGGTGSGKSTIISLILRFYDVDEGQVLINGVDVRDLKQKELRSILGYVPQRAHLFSGTISENLRFGKNDASYEELTEATKTAQAHSFIEGKDGQFEGHVAQLGTNFSGGQKQRLSIARAIVRDPQIYLFDDSFSALDAATDLLLRQELHKHSDRATMIVVAQRISSILHSNRILVLENGEMVGMGTHEELIKTCDIYKEIAVSQFSEEEVG